VSTRLPYYEAMDEYDKLQKNAGTNDTYQVFMVDCRIIGKK